MSSSPRPLVLWIGPNTGHLIEESSDLDPYAAVGTSLVGVDRRTSALARARALGYDVLLDDESWRNQLDADHPLRTRLPTELGWDPAFQLERSSASGVEEFAERAANAHVEQQASWLPSPGHVIREGFGTGGALCDARATEIALAHAFVENVRSRGPTVSPTNPRRRRVLATITVNLARLSHGLARALADAYAEVNADAYVIRIWNFAPNESQYRLLRPMAHRLQDTSGRPCLLDGVGRFAYMTMRDEIAGAITGYGRSRIDLRRRAADAVARQDDESEQLRGVPLYAPQILGGVPLGPAHNGLRILLLTELQCRCGSHSNGRPPSAQADQVRHNFHWDKLELAAAVEQTQQTRVAFTRRVSSASKRRRLSGLGELAGAWKVALEPAARDDPASTRSRLTL